MSVVPFDRKKAVLEMIEAMSLVKRANDRNLSIERQKITEAEEAAKAYHMMDGYIRGELAKLIDLKRRIEEEDAGS